MILFFSCERLSGKEIFIGMTSSVKKILLVNICPVCILLGWRAIIQPNKLTF